MASGDDLYHPLLTIGIRTKPGGVYEISIYKYGASHPETVLTVKFSRIENDWFTYVGYVGLDKFTIQTKVKLSLMSKGRGGAMLMFLHNGVDIAYFLSY